VQHAERFTIVCTHADLEAHRLGEGVGHHTAHFEPGDLADDHAMLDDHLGPGRHDGRRQGQMLGKGVDGRRQRFGHRPNLLPVVYLPHLDGTTLRPDTFGAPRQNTGPLGSQDLQRGGSAAQRPRQGRTQSGVMAIVDQHPGTRVVFQCGAATHGTDLGGGLGTHAVAYQCPKGHAQQSGAAIGIHRVRCQLFEPRWP
jgi:hypothetical protein